MALRKLQGFDVVVRKLSGVMVGVAIATALVPPLSTVGFGLATGRFDFALGAAFAFGTDEHRGMQLPLIGGVGAGVAGGHAPSPRRLDRVG